ncbi:MAG TPA: MarR family transcriptional regulator [Acidimicrobiia bacterium]|nr:MarR family transcriptional regulator [Acidimicrobiia bacterium]
MQTAAVFRLFALGTVLGSSMAEGLAEMGLTSARAEVIWRLHQMGPMNQRQLSEALQCSPRNVTGLVDALEEQGLVERRPHPTDRRAILVTLTTEGDTAGEEWTEGTQDLASDLFGEIPLAELEQFVGTLDKILEKLGVERGQLPTRTGG